MRELAISAAQFFLFIICPAFQDLAPGDATGYRGAMSEFTLMDNVVSKKPIVNIKRTANILQRRDASCDLVYKKVAGADVRQIEVTEVYGAAKQCNHEFYQGALKDWRNSDGEFFPKILPFFKSAVAIDMVSNSYFGDVSRPNNPASQWSTNIYDGVFKWMIQYYKAGAIAADRGISLANSDIAANPTAAYNLIVSMYSKQSALMGAEPTANKAFYVTQAIADGYSAYLTLAVAGSDKGASTIIDGITYLAYKSIPIIVEPLWQPIMFELFGANSNAAVLTLRGNFVFGTDKEYGEDSGELDENGKALHEALMVWYEKKELSWYFQQFLKAGTQIALPEMLVFAVPPAMLA